jgi:hypothetical protein
VRAHLPVLWERGVAGGRLLDVNVLTPLMVYFPFIFTVAQRYRKDSGVGTIISMMLPYALIMLVAWTLFFVLFFASSRCGFRWDQDMRCEASEHHCDADWIQAMPVGGTPNGKHLDPVAPLDHRQHDGANLDHAGALPAHI